MTRTAARLAGAVAALGACLALASPAAADVPPGFDLFETDPEATVFSFREEFTIPPNFFDDGSQPFQGDVNFGGLPLLTFQGQNVGDADTVVRRPEVATLPGPGSQDPNVPIELVQLSLQSIAPIQVQVGSATQLWDIAAAVSAARPSEGRMRIVQSEANGGMFDSQLEVYPRFTFTRLSDNATRTIDLGAADLPPQSRQKLVLRADAVPWRIGCIPPALPVPGLNDGFCPALTPGGDMQPAVEAAPLARHGVRPAQPRLEHFKCWTLRKPNPPFQPRSVQLQDQFGAHTARAVRPVELCNPAQKNKEPWVNRDAHLECYSIDRTQPSFTEQKVLVRNQFGSDTLTVVRPHRLCLPTSKTKARTNPAKLTAEQLIDHFRCYAVKGSKFAERKVAIRDQFGREGARLLRARLLCAPVLKNKTPALHPVQHLVCYTLKRAVTTPLPARLVRVRNQFRRKVTVTLKPIQLCVPSLKVRVR